ncbi:MAG: hydrogenase 3 maturation endopeptidase HyCI [Candidatus Omnitrophota bacterium]|nr:MAG: hydrogenase 3 maturation endopeptidase HyCI [Candidatus Omnitrophota bacterium]
MDLNSRLKGKVVVVGIGNTMRSDDGVGPILAERIKDKVPFSVFNVGQTPENYLEKIIREEPDTILLVDALDFGGKPGEIRIFDGKDLETTNLFFTHNSSITLLINYLKSNLSTDIIILIIQPKTIDFGEQLSPEVTKGLERTEKLFYGKVKNKG